MGELVLVADSLGPDLVSGPYLNILTGDETQNQEISIDENMVSKSHSNYLFRLCIKKR